MINIKSAWGDAMGIGAMGTAAGLLIYAYNRIRTFSDLIGYDSFR
jgi:hypothetical protein